MTVDSIKSLIQDNSYVVIFTWLVGMCPLLKWVRSRIHGKISDLLSYRVPISVPVGALITVVPATLFYIWVSSIERPFDIIIPETPSQTITGQKFGTQTIVIDGKMFIDCDIDGTELVYKGTAPFGFKYCRIPRCKIVFTGYAAQTAQTMSDFNAQPALKAMFKDMMSQINDGKWRPYIPANQSY